MKQQLLSLTKIHNIPTIDKVHILVDTADQRTSIYEG